MTSGSWLSTVRARIKRGAFEKAPRSRLWIPGLLLWLGTANCSLLYDLSPDQCEVNADCEALGDEFAGRICVAGVCQARSSNTGGNGGTGGVGGTGGTSGNGGEGGGSEPECTTHAQCLDVSGQFAPEVCIEGECVPLLTPECPVALPQTDELWLENLRSENPVIIGSYAFVPTNLIGLQTRNYDLALTEVTRKTNGLQFPDGKRRQVVSVVCRNTFEDRSSLDASTQHLFEELKVPAIISGLLADDLQYAFEERGGREHDVFFMSPLEADSTLVALDDDDLVWHMLPSGQDVAVTYQPLLDRAIQYLGTQPSPPETVKVALVTANDVRSLSDMSSTVAKTIRFNDKSAVQNGDDFLALGITSSYTDPEPDLTGTVESLLAFEPNVVILLTADESLKTLIPLLEDSWPDGTNPPFYLLSPSHYNNPELPGLMSSRPALQARLAGVNFASAEDLSIYESYLLAFRQAYPDVPAADAEGRENFYDAAYFLLYSMAASGKAEGLTGLEVASGMKRLLSGESFEVGKDDLPEAFGTLSGDSEATITLNGALGAPLFDPETGARKVPGSVWCVDDTLQSRVDVLRYDPESMTLDGEFPCISGF